jgi:hypothetical protein
MEEAPREEIAQDYTSIPTYVPTQKITIEEAYQKCGGFGRFQWFNAICNAISFMGPDFFLFSFAFLEVEPVFMC